MKTTDLWIPASALNTFAKLFGSGSEFAPHIQLLANEDL